MNRLLNYFLQGLLYIAPFGITFYIFYLIFNFTDSILDEALHSLIKVDIPGLGIIVIIILLILIGIVGQSIIAKPFKLFFKQILDKTPFLKVIYSAINDLFSAFVGKEKKFNKPVLVIVNPAANIEKLGFLTSEDLSELGEKEKVAVYFPHSYNFSGELFIVPKENVRPVNINPAVVMKFIISGGVSDFSEDQIESKK